MLTAFQAVAGLLILVALPGPADACSCRSPDVSEKTSVSREFKQAHAVFLGYVQAETRQLTWQEGELTGDAAEIATAIGATDSKSRYVRVRVLKVWKGDLREDTWIDVFADDFGGGGCGYHAELDTAYIVFSHPENSYAISSCSNSGAISWTSHYIPWLEKLAKKERKRKRKEAARD